MHRLTSNSLIFAAAIAIVVSPLSVRAGTPEIDHCYVSLIDDVQVAAQESGLLVDVRDEAGRIVIVEEGQTVQRGQQIAQVDDERPRLQQRAADAELKAALARSEDDIEVRYAEAAYRVAQAEHAAAEEANRRVNNTVPQAEVRRLQLTQHRAYLQIDRSKLDRNVARLNADVSRASVEAAAATMKRCRIEAPIDGILLALMKKPGEWVESGEPVARVARMDRLRVEGFLSAADYNPSEIAGRPVTVYFELARGRKVHLPGKVTFVSPLVQAGNRYRVRAEVANATENSQWLLRPGMPARMSLDLGHLR